ncbi:MAG: cell division protein CrgA [Acidimicrobiia bacterium]
MPVSKGKRSRYTPPAPKKKAASPLWVPAVMFTLLFVGTLVIITNYLGILPGEQQNRYLLLGLVQITAGFIFATLYR